MPQRKCWFRMMRILGVFTTALVLSVRSVMQSELMAALVAPYTRYHHLVLLRTRVTMCPWLLVPRITRIAT
jgi:hypothetical protein